MIEIEGMQDIGSQFLLSFKFSSTLIARRKARSACDAIPAPTTLALIALPMDSAGFRSSGSTRNSDEGQLSRDTRESPLGKLEKIHTNPLSFFFSLSLCTSFAPAFPLSGIGASRSLAIRNEFEEENRYGDLLCRRERRRSVYWTDNSA